jgi:hypothetical protein
MRADDRSGHRRHRTSPREALRAYTESGGIAFYFIANGDDVIGVRNGIVSVITFQDYREVARLGPLAGSRAQWMDGPEGPVAIITFADGARYYSRAIIASCTRDAAEEIAEYNTLAGYVPGPVGYVPADRAPARQDEPGMFWSCRFCQTSGAGTAASWSASTGTTYQLNSRPTRDGRRPLRGS